MSIEDMIAAGLGFDQSGGEPRTLPWPALAPRIVIPQRDFDGTLIGLLGRRTDGDGHPAYVSAPGSAGYAVFRPAGYPEAGLWVVTSGASRSLALLAGGMASVAILGHGRGGAQALRIAPGLGRRRVVVCGDATPAGRRFTDRVADILGAGRFELPVGVPNLKAWRVNGGRS